MANVLEKEQKLLNTLMMEMIAFDTADPKRIQHFLKVHSLARLIAEEEGMDTKTKILIEAAALVHSIAAIPAESKLGKSDSATLEELGPDYARDLLKEVGFSDDTTERVAWLVGHQHTFDNDTHSADHQILIEAIYLVNLYENNASDEEKHTALKTVFRSATGTELLYMMFGM